jgi:hypothetical protein
LLLLGRAKHLLTTPAKHFSFEIFKLALAMLEHLVIKVLEPAINFLIDPREVLKDSLGPIIKISPEIHLLTAPLPLSSFTFLLFLFELFFALLQFLRLVLHLLILKLASLLLLLLLFPLLISQILLLLLLILLLLSAHSCGPILLFGF